MSILAVSAAAKAGKDVTSLLVKQAFTEALTPESIEMLLEDPERLVGAFDSPAVVRKFFANQDFQDSFFKQTANYRNRAVGTLIGTPTEGPYDTIDQVGGDHRVIAAMVRLNPADYLDWAALVADPVALGEITGTTPRLLQHSTQAMDSIAGSTSAIGQIAGTQAGRKFLLGNVDMRPKIITLNDAGAAALAESASDTLTGLDYILADLEFLTAAAVTPSAIAGVTSNALVVTGGLTSIMNSPEFMAEVAKQPTLVGNITRGFLTRENGLTTILTYPNFMSEVYAQPILVADTTTNALSRTDGLETILSNAGFMVEVRKQQLLVDDVNAAVKTKNSVDTWPLWVADAAQFDTVFADPIKFAEVLEISEALHAISADAVAMGKVAGNQGYVDNLFASADKMNTVATYAAARTAIDASALATASHTNMSYGKHVIGLVGHSSITPDETADWTSTLNDPTLFGAVTDSTAAMESVVNSQLAMDSIVASQTALDTVVASQLAMDEVVASTLAMDTVADSSLARTTIGFAGLAFDTISASNAAIGKLTAAYAGLVPSSYVDMTAIATEQIAMDAVVAAQAAMNAITASQAAMDAITASQLAMDTIVSKQSALDWVTTSQLAMNSIAASQLAMDSIVASTAGLAKVVSSALAMESVASSTLARDTINNSESIWYLGSPKPPYSDIAGNSTFQVTVDNWSGHWGAFIAVTDKSGDSYTSPGDHTLVSGVNVTNISTITIGTRTNNSDNSPYGFYIYIGNVLVGDFSEVHSLTERTLDVTGFSGTVDIRTDFNIRENASYNEFAVRGIRFYV